MKSNYLYLVNYFENSVPRVSTMKSNMLVGMRLSNNIVVIKKERIPDNSESVYYECQIDSNGSPLWNKPKISRSQTQFRIYI